MNIDGFMDENLDESSNSENKENDFSDLDVSSQHRNLDLLLDKIKSLSTEISALSIEFESRLRYDQTKEEAFNRLYADLEFMRGDAEFEKLRPFYIDLILFFDRIDRALHPIDNGALSNNEQQLLNSLLEELLEIFYRREIEIINPSPVIFDPTVQRAIGTVTTEEENENNAVATVIRRGFRYSHRLLRPEEVIIKKLSISANK